MENKDKKTNEEEQNENAGKLSGIGAGVITGAAIGTSILPVVGTFAGALVGGEVGKKVGGSLLNKFSGKDKKEEQSADKADVTAELQKLAKLHKDGILSDDEFRAAKAQLLNL